MHAARRLLEILGPKTTLERSGSGTVNGRFNVDNCILIIIYLLFITGTYLVVGWLTEVNLFLACLEAHKISVAKFLMQPYDSVATFQLNNVKTVRDRPYVSMGKC